ncbi:hypothetical protein [Ruminococcus flavefaciens]|uniref:hypothetical protein n=1 Tax=Ruminococcus flavefaciens TaxID=1265 RepID=UPI001A9A4694|nr:hypothetical protein [Ruminococcus flavefaciens]
MCRSSAVQMENCRIFRFSRDTWTDHSKENTKSAQQPNIAPLSSDFEKSGQNVP